MEAEITRTEIAEALAGAFDHERAIDPSELATQALSNGARPEVAEILAHLSRPAGYRELRELWSELYELPLR